MPTVPAPEPIRRRKPFSGLLARFACNESGSFASMFGLTAVAATLCAGVAVDYSRVAHTRAVMTDSLDAALLAAGKLMSDGETNRARLRGEFDDFFFANLETRKHHGGRFEVLKFDADPATGEVSAETGAEVKMAFMGLLGTNQIDVSSRAQARFSTDAVEIAMVLDVTGSMRGSKIRALKAAASDAVDILLPADTTSDKVRIGLVPYSWSVNVGRNRARTVAGNRDNGCVTERHGRNAHTDADWRGRRENRLGADYRMIRETACPTSKVRGLTNRRDTLKGDIRGFRPDGWTAGHIGIGWGYYMLSEHWQPLWNRREDPRDYGVNVKKIAILMTDGEFNTYYEDPDGDPWGPHANESNAHAVRTCADMKARKGADPGIIIYSVAFQAPKSARKTLRACASPDEGGRTFYFDADSEQELRAAFQAIAIDIQKLRLSQ